jgi:hypothetical protein
MAIDLAGMLSTGVDLATAYVPYEATQGQIDALNQIASTYSDRAQTIGQEAAQATQFQPFSVKTATGTADVNAAGGVDYNVSPELQALQSSLYNQALTGAQAAPVTADSLYQQLQSATTAQQERDRIELENRLAAQGRLGVGTALYGGTPEQLAMQKAFAEQSAQNMLAAQQAAPALQQANLANIGTAMDSYYKPETMLGSLMSPSVNLANTTQAARQGSAEALANAATSGLQAETSAYGNIANLEANRATALASALQGMFGTQASGSAGTATNTVASLFNSMFGGNSESAQELQDAGFDQAVIDMFLS